MIKIGLDIPAKQTAIKAQVQRHGITRVVMCSPQRFAFELPVAGETVDWPEIIMYRTFYRLLREIDENSLVVVNECLRSQNRYDLTYNCIRHYLNRAGHVLVFQWLPVIDAADDFMILFDFVTGSRWKRERFDEDLLHEAKIAVVDRRPVISGLDVETDAAAMAEYAMEKDKLFRTLGSKDPHTIPRTLHLLSGRAKLRHMWPERWYIGRNQRFKRDNLQTYRDAAYPHVPYTVFEWPHNFIDFADFLCLSGQTEIAALTSGLPVDQWYLERYRQWSWRVADVSWRVADVIASLSA